MVYLRITHLKVKLNTVTFDWDERDKEKREREKQKRREIFQRAVLYFCSSWNSITRRHGNSRPHQSYHRACSRRNTISWDWPLFWSKSRCWRFHEHIPVHDCCPAAGWSDAHKWRWRDDKVAFCNAWNWYRWTRDNMTNGYSAAVI